ncbi:hypothetical protein [Nocardia arizonensis]|uniref:hypothetical protein n=1 Tax=Nocardia arizonensis TaxID=1141647 RepID=UPI0006CF722C|nr:hypothetical protein [Nocardia arizonensis]
MAFDGDDEQRSGPEESSGVEPLSFLTDLLLDSQLKMAELGHPDLVERFLDLSRRLATHGPDVDDGFARDFGKATLEAAEVCETEDEEGMDRPGSETGELYWNLCWGIIMLSFLREKGRDTP